jgi:hypothetical protein
MDKWNIVIARGATYQQTITVTGVADIASATLWRITMAMPNEPPFVIATTANGKMTAGSSASQKILGLPAAETEVYPLGNGRFDFDIEWTGGIVRRYISNGTVQVNPEVGA